MKTGKSLTKKILTGIMAVFILSFVAVGIGCNDDDDEPTPVDNTPYTLSGNASASQMVPLDSSLAGLTGTGTLTGTYDPAINQLIYTATWTGLTGAPIAGGLYNGASGAVGTFIDTTWAFDSTFTATGSISDTINLSPDRVQSLVAGNWYYLFKTEAHPEGEIRGQITATR